MLGQTRKVRALRCHHESCDCSRCWNNFFRLVKINFVKNVLLPEAHRRGLTLTLGNTRDYWINDIGGASYHALTIDELPEESDLGSGKLV